MTGGLSLSELTAAIAERTGGRLRAEIRGNPAQRLTAVAPLATAGAGDLTFLANPRYRRDAATTRAGALVLSAADAEALGGGTTDASLAIVDEPYAWFALAAGLLHPANAAQPGVAPGACVHPGAEVDPAATIATGAVIGQGARIGAGAVIDASAIVGAGATIGRDSHLYPRAVVLDGCIVGERCIVHSGAVIGADGFGFAPLDGRWIKIPQVGRVLIGDDVEIGANTTVDRGTMGETVIESGVKLDNQVQIGHNCFVGANTVIAGCVGVAGSARIGRNCQIGGAAMIAGHLSIADGCAIGPGTLVPSSIDVQGHYTGFFPMMKNHDWQKSAAIIRQLEDLRRRIRDLEMRHGGETK